MIDTKRFLLAVVTGVAVGITAVLLLAVIAGPVNPGGALCVGWASMAGGMWTVMDW